MRALGEVLLRVAAMFDVSGVPSSGTSRSFHLLFVHLLLGGTLAGWSSTNAEAFELRDCEHALGMETGVIPDAAISASSSYVPNVGAHNGRLKFERNGGAWCPKQQVERGVREWLQVDLGEVHVITGVQTQGRYDHGRGQEYTEEYMLEYWRPGLTGWQVYSRWDGKQIMSGNSDTSTIVSHSLMPPVFASQVRLLPYSVHRRTVCLRLEILGCLFEGGIVSYQIPEGAYREPGLDLRDASYDGERRNGELYSGLGQLVDGEVGGDSFRMDIGYGKGNGWVGWKNDTGTNRYVELVFEFDQIRNFSAVCIFTNNFFSRDVQVFSKAKIYFSIGGKFFNGRPLVYSYMPDTVLEHARNVTINLHHGLGRFVKMQLYFASKWIMISEIYFDSVPATGNFTPETEPNASLEEIILNPEGAWDGYETISAKKEGQSYVEVIIGVLTAIMLLLLIVFIVILVLSRRQKLQGSPTILRNPFGVTINMKDLLMNLAPVNNGMVHVNSHTPPATQEPPSEPPSLYFEQYRSPLVNTYYGTTNYAGTASLRSASIRSNSANNTVSDDNSPPQEFDVMSTAAETPGRFSPVHFRSLQSTPVVTTRSQIVNLNTYFPPVSSDPPTRKRYHTAPREKHRLPPPIVSWNIAPSMGHSYKCREAEVVQIPRYCLRVVEKIGSCHAGEVILCETEGLEDLGIGRMVAVKTTNPDKVQSTESLRETRFLANLSDQNVARVLGICTAEEPWWLVLEYPELGDLAQFLQYRIPKNASMRPSNVKALSYGCLIDMAGQIASGMKYLESKNIVHKDLAARNCLVARGNIVKISDVAMCSARYRDDYSEIGGRPPAPIRWLPWESILLDRYTCPSSAWSFAVTVWEILTLGREKPYPNLTNEQVIQNAENMYYGGELQVLLPKPTLCTTEMYELMCECWKRDESLRPAFKEIHMFFKRKNIGYQP